MIYSEYKEPSWSADIKRVDSKYLPILNGHLVIIEINQNNVQAAIHKTANEAWGRNVSYQDIFPISKQDLLDLKDTIDKALKNFSSLEKG